MPKRDQTGTKNPSYRHGMYSTPEYKHWIYMKQRCSIDPKYTTRGITVHASWQSDFMAFYEHIGPKPRDGKRYTVDRIDNDGNYEPGNVRWATPSQQNLNRGEVSLKAKMLREAADTHDLHLETVRYRMANGTPLSAPKYGKHTHCRNGHEYTDATTYVDKNGIRHCRTCRNASMRKYRASTAK